MDGNLTKINLPPWDPQDPVYWFTRAEGDFELLKGNNGVALPLTDKKKLTLVGNAIPADIIHPRQAIGDNQPLQQPAYEEPHL